MECLVGRRVGLWMMANTSGGAETAMKNVIAQLGERQHLSSNVTSSGRPSTAATKPAPPVKKPIETGGPSPGHVAVKPTPPPLTAKPSFPAVQPAAPANKRPPVTARKPSDTSLPGTGLTEHLGHSRLKPTVAGKSPMNSPSSSVSTSSAAESVEETTSSAPPWQNMVRKKNVPTTPARRQAETSSVTQTTTSVAKTANSYVEDQSTDGSTTSAYDGKQSHDSESTSTEDATSSVAARVRGLKEAFEAAAATEGAEESSRRASSGRHSTSKDVAKYKRCQSSTVEHEGEQGGVSPSIATGFDKPNDSSTQPQPINGCSSVITDDQQEIVIGVDGLRYCRLPAPGEPTTRPNRKPAKPPVVDLTPYRSFVATASVAIDDDEVYDDVGVEPQSSEDVRVTRRGSGTAGRQNATSVVSQISEYTAEEEERDRRRWKGNSNNATVVCSPAPLSPSGDDIYDDVATADVYDDEIYQELD